jgi:exosortase B
MALTTEKAEKNFYGIPAFVSDYRLELALASAIFLAFIPTLIRLANGPWQSEQEGHGPIIIAAAGWLAWQAWTKEERPQGASAPVAGWIVLLLGLAVLIVTRSQDVLMLETGSQIPIIAGAILISAGWRGLKTYAFPLGFLIFAVPPPGWMLDIFTVPLKIQISDWATELLYRLDFPISQNGVMIMIGNYQLMVKDACSGMNSIFALSAIGFFYVHEFIKNSPFRSIVMLLSIIPITVAANFVRVLALIMLAYYGGEDYVEGLFHDLTGFLLFAVALLLFFMLDGVLIALTALFKVFIGRRPAANQA